MELEIAAAAVVLNLFTQDLFGVDNESQREPNPLPARIDRLG